MLRLALVFIVFATSKVTSQEACIEPFRPDANYLTDGGYKAQEMREVYRGYFFEVEGYLNCLNRSSARIRQQATAAAQDYNRVLDQYPVQLGQPEQVPGVEMRDSGTLFLDYEAKWLQ